jgi:hypothetical protein
MYRILVRVRDVSVISSLCLCRNNLVFHCKNSSPLKGHVPVYLFASFLVMSTSFGEQWPVYRGLYTVGENGEEYICPTWQCSLRISPPPPWHFYMYFMYNIVFDFCIYFCYVVVCILAMQRPIFVACLVLMWTFEINKTSFIGRNKFYL